MLAITYKIEGPPVAEQKEVAVVVVAEPIPINSVSLLMTP